MSRGTDGSAHAHPVDQGNVGQEVADALHVVADLVRLLNADEEDEMLRRVLNVANYAGYQRIYLTERKEEVGRLCPDVERELRQAECVLRILEQLALQWTVGDVDRRVPGSDEEREVIVPRTEYVDSMVRLADFIWERFPSNTAERWQEMARATIEEGPRPRRIGH